MRKQIRFWLFVPGLAAVLAAVTRYTLELKWSLAESVLLLAGMVVLGISILINRRTLYLFYKRRSTVHLAFSIVSSLVMIALLFLVNFIVWLHPLKLDLTAKRFFTLSEQTVRVMRGLTENIKVVSFFKETEQDWQLASLLKEYAALNRRFTYRFIDPDREPSITQDYGVGRYRTVIMESADRRLRVLEPSEGGLTNTLLRLVQRKPASVCFLTGHGEHDVDSQDRQGFQQARKALEETNYEAKVLDLAQAAQVPADCTVLVIAGARETPSAIDLEKTQSYLDGGGSLLLLLDPSPAVGFGELLARYGLKSGEDVVIDASGAGRTIGAGPDTPYIQSYPHSEIIPAGFLPTFYPRARSLSVAVPPPKGVTLLQMVVTSPSSWGETELGSGGGGVRYDEGKDLKGPLALAVQVTDERRSAASSPRPNEKRPTTKLVCFGDSDFATNVRFNVQGNGDLFTNSVHWLANRTDIVAIRPKKADNKRLDLSVRSNIVVFYVCVMLLPAIPAAAGIRILIRRFR